MEGEHKPETDLTRCHEVSEEGDKFESSFLTLDRCCFLTLLRVDTHLLQALWNDLRLCLLGFGFQEEDAILLKQLPHHRIQSTKSGWMDKITEDGIG